MINQEISLFFLLIMLGFVEPARAQQRHITSVLQIMDMKSGDIEVSKEFPFRIEAPFWSKDGKEIIYNSDGKLFKIESNLIKTPKVIKTAGTDKLNNDHVLSPNGREIGISNQAPPDGKSRIFIVPFQGGLSRLITPEGPSYLHGWSPDGKTLAYCAERNGNFDVYTISVGGGTEKRLTDAEGLDDGPEYSPDGKYIWFNSVRTGTMQIWRMNADGSDQQQITFDEDVYSWFPHISPDGKHVVYIVYHKGDVGAGEHLADKNVELRLMPASGGKAKTIFKLFGGQGTINVNSWSPDSKKIAFVSYRIENRN